jgi:ABC-type bacteriocin/lantibiotic exporter with double-glycine peptidase domain
MKTIKQKEENDCGVACVAMLAGVSYDEARAVIYPNGRAKLTKTKDLSAALKKLGREPLSDRRQPFGSQTLQDLETDALVFVELKNGNASKHWVVWDAKAKKPRDPYHTKYDHHLRGYLAVRDAPAT